MDHPEELLDRAELDIAIIGMAGRFPGANDVDTFWRNLQDGVESVTFYTDEELLARGIDSHRCHRLRGRSATTGDCLSGFCSRIAPGFAYTRCLGHLPFYGRVPGRTGAGH